MLTMPANAGNVVTIVGLDPGSNTLGLAVLFIDVLTWEILHSEARTYVGTKLCGKHDWVSEIHGERIGRINAHENNLLQVFRHYQPLAIVSESPFYSQRRPQAFGALTEVISAIRRSVMQFDIWRDLKLVDPPTVKKAVGAPGNADKNVVKNHILTLSALNYNGAIPIHCLDEHSIDALAVAYSEFLSMRERLCLRS